MLAVIFRAKTGNQDSDYIKTATKLRDLAFESYGCIDFVAVTEGEQEIAISYWKDEESINNWKKNAEHSLAQEFGRNEWYESYIVEVVEIKEQYKYNT